MTGKRYLGFPLIAFLLGVCLSCGKSDVTDPDGGPLFEVEVEHFSSSFDDEASQYAVTRILCVTASNDTTVIGMDVPGEWITVSVDVPEDGVYTPYLYYASQQGAVISVRLEMTGCGESTTSDFLLTDGTGLG